MAAYRECYYESEDGLRLFYRDYPSPGRLTPVLCIPGLTRNSRDFDFIAAHLAERRRVLCADLRGRGRSAYDPEIRNYVVPVETRDMLRLLATAGIARVVALGTSRGGVIAMMMATMAPDVLAGAILNDIGAQLEAEGLERIYEAMRTPPAFADWDAAASALRHRHEARFVGLDDQRWAHFARALYREDEGRIVGDFDPAFPRSVLQTRGSNPRTDAGAVDLWRLYGALASIPTLVLRGANSDLLSAEVVRQMKARKPDLVAVEVMNRGHVPFLDEPEAVAAIDAFLDLIP